MSSEYIIVKFKSDYMHLKRGHIALLIRVNVSVFGWYYYKWVAIEADRIVFRSTRGAYFDSEVTDVIASSSELAVPCDEKMI